MDAALLLIAGLWLEPHLIILTRRLHVHELFHARSPVKGTGARWQYTPYKRKYGFTYTRIFFNSECNNFCLYRYLC